MHARTSRLVLGLVHEEELPLVHQVGAREEDLGGWVDGGRGKGGLGGGGGGGVTAWDAQPSSPRTPARHGTTRRGLTEARGEDERREAGVAHGVDEEERVLRQELAIVEAAGVRDAAAADHHLRAVHLRRLVAVCVAAAARLGWKTFVRHKKDEKSRDWLNCGVGGGSTMCTVRWLAHMGD